MTSPPRRSFADECAAPCCATMKRQLTNACEEHAADPYSCPDALVSYSAVFDEYGIIVHDGGPSSVLIQFCPWCGSKLPDSQRDLWFDEIEKLGFKGLYDPGIPEPYKTAAWRLNRAE